jgi:hypothetical protein
MINIDEKIPVLNVLSIRAVTNMFQHCVQIYVEIKSVPFLMSLSTAALSHRKYSSAWASHGTCHSQVHEQRDAV